MTPGNISLVVLHIPIDYRVKIENLCTIAKLGDMQLQSRVSDNVQLKQRSCRNLLPVLFTRNCEWPSRATNKIYEMSPPTSRCLLIG